MVFTNIKFRISNWFRMLSLWIRRCTLRSVNVGSFWIHDEHYPCSLGYCISLFACGNFSESWVKSNHIAAGALLSADDPQILSTLENFGSGGPFTRNEIPRESKPKDKTYFANAVTSRSHREYNSDFFLSFPGTADQLSQNSSENLRRNGGKTNVVDIQIQRTLLLLRDRRICQKCN
jgi:hypothetical protein